MTVVVTSWDATGDDEAIRQIAQRFRLAVPKDRWSEPWRYFLLAFLAFCWSIDDYENRYFGHVEARIMLETLRDDIDEVLTHLRRHKP